MNWKVARRTPSSPRCRRMLPHLALFIGLAGVAAGDETTYEPVSPAAEAAGIMMRSLVQDGGVGVQVAVVRGGTVRWSAAFGLADVEAGVVMTPATRLRIGSVTKVFTAALAARLVDAGRLDPDEPVQRRLPDFPVKDGEVTVRRLATHTSGVRQYDFGDIEEANNVRRYESLEEALQLFAEDPLVAPAGSSYHYSSLGYNLLGIVAARAAGRPFLAALDEWVTGPLALPRTGGDLALPIVEGRGRFYTVLADGTVLNTVWRDSSDYYPSGGLLSTAEEVARLAWATFAGDALGGESRRLVSTPARLASGEIVDRTFGWQISVRDDGSVAWFGHGGLTNGATAEVRYEPARDLAVAVIANYNFWFEGRPRVIAAAVEEVAALFAETDGD